MLAVPYAVNEKSALNCPSAPPLIGKKLKGLPTKFLHANGPCRGARDGEGVTLIVGVTERDAEDVLLDEGVREIDGV